MVAFKAVFIILLLPISIVQGPCVPACVNGGTCAVSTCNCTPGWGGVDCSVASGSPPTTPPPPSSAPPPPPPSTPPPGTASPDTPTAPTAPTTPPPTPPPSSVPPASPTDVPSTTTTTATVTVLTTATSTASVITTTTTTTAPPLTSTSTTTPALITTSASAAVTGTASTAAVATSTSTSTATTTKTSTTTVMQGTSAASVGTTSTSTMTTTTNPSSTASASTSYVSSTSTSAAASSASIATSITTSPASGTTASGRLPSVASPTTSSSSASFTSTSAITTSSNTAIANTNAGQSASTSTPSTTTTTTPIPMSTLCNISDANLVTSAANISAAVVSFSTYLASTVTSSTASDGIAALDSVTVLFSRLANQVDKITPAQAASISTAFAAAASTVVTSLDLELPQQSASSTTSATIETTSSAKKCQLTATTATPTTSPPVLSNQQTQHMYDQLLNVTQTIAVIIATSQSTTSDDFVVNEKFFSLRIAKRELRKIPGQTFDTQLASVYFPDSSELAGEHLFQESSSMQPTDVVTVVIYGYLKNVFDVSQNFNTPTTSLAVYDDTMAPLKLNPKVNVLQIGKPVVSKAQSFVQQKVEAQCDASKITCNVKDNANQLVTVITFQLIQGAGDFTVIIPPIEFDYWAYFGLNGVPTVSNYTWLLQVKGSGDSAGATLFSNSSVTLPFSFNQSTGLRTIVRAKSLSSKNGQQGAQMLYVVAKKNFNGQELSKLSTSACDLLRVYGYHLLLASASKDSASRKRRDASSDTLEVEPNLQLQPDSTESAIKFKSNYFGNIGADLAIPPNTIAFSDVFANFSTLVADNWAVLAFMCVAVVFFLIGVVIAWLHDKDDINQWAYLPLMDNMSYHEYQYLVSVNQHGAKNYNEHGRVWLRLVGEVDATKWRCLKDCLRKNFKRAHPENFEMKTNYGVGTELKLQMSMTQEDSASRGRPMSVFIDDVLVLDVERGCKFVFKVHQQLTANDGQVHSCELAREDDVKNWGYLVKKHMRSNISEDHPWISIMSRPLPSNWTRVERLACVVSGLFLAMLVNCMFYGKEATLPDAGIVLGGAIRISWFTIWTSFIGCLIIIPPTFCVGLIFKKVKRRSAVDEDKLTVFNLKIETDEEGKKTCQLPFGFVVVAWILVAACIGASAFFIVMYSLTWGRDKSLQWLCGMILHVVQDVFIIQTIRVVILAIFSSTMLQSPEDGVHGDLKLALHSDNKNEKTELFRRFRSVMVGIVHNICYVVSFALVIGAVLNPYAYKQLAAVKPLLLMRGVTFNSDPIEYAAIFNWLTGQIASNFLNGNQYFSEKLRNVNFYSVPNHDFYLIGPIRLRQQRVQLATCPLKMAVIARVRNVFNNLTNCQEDYSTWDDFGTSSERRIFNGSWSSLVPSSVLNSLDSNTSTALKNSAWSYRDTSGIAYAGYQAVYGTGGYYVDLPTNSPTNILSTLLALRAARWLDNATTVLFVEFTIMNPQLNFFMPIKVVFEAMPAGGLIYHARLYPLQLYLYFGASAMLVLAVQGVWFLLNITHTIKIAIKIKKTKSIFFKDGWNLLETGTVLLSFVIMAVFALRFPSILSAISAIKTDQKAFVSLDSLANWEDLMMGLFGIAFMANLILFFRHLSFNKQWSVFVGVFARGKTTIFFFLGLFVLLSLIFALFGNLLLGNRDNQFSSIARSLLTLCYNVIGFSPTFMTNAESSKLAFLYYSTYAFLVYFIGVQVFVAVIVVTYREVSANVDTQTHWDRELSVYISDGFSQLASFGRRDGRSSATVRPAVVKTETKVESSAFENRDDWYAAIDNHSNRRREGVARRSFSHVAITQALSEVSQNLERKQSYDYWAFLNNNNQPSMQQ